MFIKYMYTFLALQDHNLWTTFFLPVSLPYTICSQYLILELALNSFVQITVHNSLVFFNPFRVGGNSTLKGDSIYMAFFLVPIDHG